MNRYFLRMRARTHMPMRIGPRTHIGSSDTDYGGGGGVAELTLSEP
jgi:hypothetical protein